MGTMLGTEKMYPGTNGYKAGYKIFVPEGAKQQNPGTNGYTLLEECTHVPSLMRKNLSKN